ncbi:transmembrane protein 126A [Candoia aspera]|uniref:transmembrane protein 126A n=1 Tax=Candoia aspera TaxID=51853 RepID=UPI002FD8406A
MAGKEFLDLPVGKKFNIGRVPAAVWEKRFEKLTPRDQNLFQNGGFALALNSSLCALISNNAIRNVLNITQSRYSTVSTMVLLPFISTTVAYEGTVKSSLMAGNLNCEVCATIRGGLVGAVVGYLYPIILALPLNALLATRYHTSPMPNKENAVRFWISLSKPVFRKTRLGAVIQAAIGAYLGSKHHEIYLKMLRMPEPGRDPEEFRE